MVVLVLVVGAAVLCCSVLLAFGCVCHLFKRHGGFTNFEDDPEYGRSGSMYPPNESAHDMSNVSFEPLPDILAKTVGSRALRPRITCFDKEKQSNAAKLVTVYQPFPRNQLLYVKEIGLGWFGQVLQGTAENIVHDSRHSKVVVKILKDDATATEKSLFLEEVAPYRDIDHENIVQLLGQCTETSPFLTVLEFPAMGDLKSYLLGQNKGPLIQFAMDAARGLACMHKHSYIHHDFSARNCLLMSDLRLKVGDYGIGEDLFREDYYDTGRDLLPIRWMSPESLELKQGVWQPTQFTYQSNVWSLSILMWEILAMGRKPYSNLRDEDVLQKVIREGTTKLPPPSSDFPLHDRWYEIMEMCWQEVEDRPAADDILAFLQQVNEEASEIPDSNKSSTISSNSASPKVVEGNQTGAQSPKVLISNSVQSKPKNQSNHHVAEVLVHRVDEHGHKHGFDDDFSKLVQIKKNKDSSGFEDDFVHDANSNFNYSADISQNDSILAFGGNPSESTDFNEQEQKYKDMFSADTNMNLVPEPVPVQMSTPSKYVNQSRTDQSEAYNTALSNQTTQNSKFITAVNSNTHSAYNTDFVNSKSLQSSAYNSDLISNRSEGLGNSLLSKHSKDTLSEKSDNPNLDEGYRTDINGTPDIILNGNQSEEIEMFVKSDSASENTNQTGDFLKQTDFETEKAKEIYMSKGAAIPPSSIHKSRSLGTIPEDGVPSDNTSQSGVVFDDENEDIGMNFEWDDYEGEELVGRVRYSSDELTRSPRSPRHVEVEEWPFEQDSSSESHSKPGSIASDSDAEVTRLSIDSTSSIDTRARIASILTNRLNSLIKQTNHSDTGQSMFYSFSQYDNDLDSPEHAITDPDHLLENASADKESQNASPSMPREDVKLEEGYGGLVVEESQHGQDDQLIKQDLDQIAKSVLDKNDANTPNVSINDPHEQMLTSQTDSVVA